MRHLGLDLFQLFVSLGLQLLIAVLQLLSTGLKLLIGGADLAILRLDLVELLFELLDQFAVARAIRSQLAQLAFDLPECLGLRVGVIRQRPGRSRHSSDREDRRRKADHHQESNSTICRSHRCPLRAIRPWSGPAECSNERAR